MLPAWTVKPKYWPVLSVTRLFRPLPSIFAISILRKYASPQYITPAESQTRSSANVTSVNTSYFKQLKYCYLMTTFWCSSDILITSWLFTARWSTWPGNHLVPCVAELVGSCVPIHERRCLPDPKCLFYPSGLSLCLSVDHFCLVSVDDMVLFHGMVCDGWLVSYTVSWSSDRTSCLSLQHMSWSSSCKGHDRSIRSSLHPWPCLLDEPQSSVALAHMLERQAGSSVWGSRNTRKKWTLSQLVHRPEPPGQGRAA